MRAGNYYLRTDAADAYEYVRYEKLLAKTIRAFIVEMQLVDAGVLIGYILCEKDRHLEHLIESSSEVWLKPGFLRYGRSASAVCDWGRNPTASIELEICHPELTAYFSLVFASDFVGVNLHGILFSRELSDEEEETWTRFSTALGDGILCDGEDGSEESIKNADAFALFYGSANLQ
ncbi:hypothetical protein [Amorphus sp. 3PC139-8]|uniref:hypothetical protein n=1 Tax=Amorphus sp. 3PC139-8 TaxID=2735676 RepID=UPI00345C8FE3